MNDINWDDPAERAGLIDRVGGAEYNRLHRAHLEASVITTVNGYPIRPVHSARWGRLFMVDGTASAFGTQAAAEDYANAQPTKGGSNV